MQIKLVITIVAMFSLSRAWGSAAHYVIASIAESELLECHSKIYDKAMTILEYLKDLTKLGEFPFIQAATWADNIEELNWETFQAKHFQPETYKFENKKLIRERKKEDMNESLLTAINQALATLQKEDTSKAYSKLAKSIELRMLMHYVGDIHQPLHTMSRVNQFRSHGDSHGSDFLISNTDSKTLHNFWDNYFDDPKWKTFSISPTESTIELIDAEADSITTDFPRTVLNDDLSRTSFVEWIYHTQNFAINQVYFGIKANSKPSEEYITKNLPILRRQLALAGYRLTDLIVSALEDVDVLKGKPTKKVESVEIQTKSVSESLGISQTISMKIGSKDIQEDAANSSEVNKKESTTKRKKQRAKNKKQNQCSMKAVHIMPMDLEKIEFIDKTEDLPEGAEELLI